MATLDDAEWSQTAPPGHFPVLGALGVRGSQGPVGPSLMLIGDGSSFRSTGALIGLFNRAKTSRVGPLSRQDAIPCGMFPCSLNLVKSSVESRRNFSRFETELFTLGGAQHVLSPLINIIIYLPLPDRPCLDYPSLGTGLFVVATRH